MVTLDDLWQAGRADVDVHHIAALMDEGHDICGDVDAGSQAQDHPMEQGAQEL